ncbi:hypothetical protein DID88_009734 [Monilinia fructigena]|uniref:Uncharacterized protein n=1 Tax=Monilinia fructigena TaxID=38457 RepID=A0A395ILY2_9HELO|nr:hypothetical protein DID88_009734 [Monilinia fructigena]
MNPRVNLRELLFPFQKVHIHLSFFMKITMIMALAADKSHEAGFDSVMDDSRIICQIIRKIYAEQTDLDQYEDIAKPDYNQYDYNFTSDSDDEEGVGGASLISSLSSTHLETTQPKC